VILDRVRGLDLDALHATGRTLAPFRGILLQAQIL
jgi:hypothetical protein